MVLPRRVYPLADTDPDTFLRRIKLELKVQLKYPGIPQGLNAMKGIPHAS